MILRDSLKNLIRSKGKTFLFFVLITMVTVLLSLSNYICVSVEKYLSACDEKYTTIALFEYMGADYPNTEIYDTGIEEAKSRYAFADLEKNRDVLLFDEEHSVLGYNENYTRSDAYIAEGDRTVLRIRPVYLGEDNRWFCTISEQYYCSRDVVNKALFLDPNGYPVKQGRTYVISGELYNKQSAYLNVILMPYDDTDPVLAEVSAGESLPEDHPLMRIRDTLLIINNAIQVTETENPQAVFSINQKKVNLAEGRFFTEEECRSHAKVCVLTDAFPYEVGDTIRLKLKSVHGVFSDAYSSQDGFDDEQEYIVVGKVSAAVENCFKIYVPQGTSTAFENSGYSYTIGTAVLRNGTVDDFLDRMEQEELPDRVKISVYDQGYSAASESYKNVLRLSRIIRGISIAISLAVLLMFTYLFVYRQRDVSQIMIRLGVVKRKVCAYFLYGAGFLSLIASLAGTAIAYTSADRIAGLVSRISAGMVIRPDTSYSLSAVSIQQDIALETNAGWEPFLYSTAAIILCTLVFSLIFTLMTFKKKIFQTGKRRVRRRASGPYLVISIVRSGIRSFLTVLLAAAAGIFLFHLSVQDMRYEKELNALTEETMITGAYTDHYGRMTGSLVITESSLEKIKASGYISRLYLSDSLPYKYGSVVEHEGERFAPEPLILPTGSFALETFMDRFQQEARLIGTNDLTKAPEFCYSSQLNVRFMDGFDLSVFQKEAFDTAVPCLITEDVMANNGISYGDHIWIYRLMVNGAIEEMELMAVGSFEKAAKKDNIYIPISAFAEISAEAAQSYRYRSYTRSYDSAQFELDSAGNLMAMKKYLRDNGFSSAQILGSERSFISLDDRNYMNSLNALTTERSYSAVFNPCLMALTCLAGLITAVMVTKSRRKEAAIMFAMGNRPYEIFLTFFFEQVILVLIGLGVSYGVSRYTGTYTETGLRLIGVFAAAWLLGTVRSISKMTNVSVLDILHEEE